MKEQEVNLDVKDPHASRPVKKENALKGLLKQISATGSPPLESEEVLPAKLIGDGNYPWYPLAWLRWLASWEMVKTLVLVVILAFLSLMYYIVSNRATCAVQMPYPAQELLLRSKGFDDFNQLQAESYIQFAVQVANQSSSEGMVGLPLLEGSIDPGIYLRLQQKGYNGRKAIPTANFPIYTTYISACTRWRYNPSTRLISVYVKGFRMKNTIAGDSSMEQYRAMIDVFWEPTTNRNRWGYYITKFEEYYGEAADAYDVELKNRDKTGF